MQNPINSNLSFMQGGGEMGELTRSHNWADSVLGSPETWPYSLRTTISILLNSKFPMFLWWGSELKQFYNDAYRPIMGNSGKHPTALGQKGKDCWPETWPIIKPLIDSVLAGNGATWAEDRLIPIYRNNALEDVYWTSSFSPVQDETGQINGVLAVCTETTEKIANFKKLEDSVRFAHSLFRSSISAQIVWIGKDFIIKTVNPRMLDLLGRDKEIVGKSFIDAVPELIDTPIMGRLENVLSSGHPFYTYEERVELVRYGKRHTGYYNYCYEVLLNEAGERYGVIGTAIEVTEQVMTRKKVEESENRFKSLIEGSSFATCLFTGRDMVITIANKTMISYWGKGWSVMDKPVAEVLPELVGQPFLQILDDVYTTGKTYEAHDARADLVIDGVPGTFYFDFSYTALRNKAGEIYGVIATSIDVTEKVLAQQEMQKTAQRLQLAVESADLGTYEVNLFTNAMSTSSRFNAIWGTAKAVGRDEFAKAIHPNDLLYRNAAISQSLETGHLNYEARIIWGDGSIHWVRVHGKVIYDDGNKPANLLGVIQDITDQKDFAEKLSLQVLQRTKELELTKSVLLASNTYQQDIINKFDTALATLVPVYSGNDIVDFSFKTSNTPYSAYSKLSPDEIQGRYVSDIFPGYRSTEAFERYVDTFKTGKNNEWDMHYHVDGLNVFLRIIASKMGEEVVVNLTDITTLKKLQLDLLQNIKDLRRSNEDLQQFAHVASHDLKEPVRKIRTFSNRMAKEFEEQLPEKAKFYTGKIEHAAVRMSDMIDGILQYSSASATNQMSDMVNLDEIINNVESDLEVLIQQKHAVFNYEKLPVITGSQLLLHQLFYNLLLNSLKFSRQDIPPVITITTYITSQPGDPSRQYVSIRLQDNGIGFGQDQVQYIFKTFTRLHSKDKYEGSGIGLALCQKIVERHGGTIEAEGTEGSGSIFTVTLPLSQNPD